jgi:hypothetical protein
MIEDGHVCGLLLFYGDREVAFVSVRVVHTAVPH